MRTGWAKAGPHWRPSWSCNHEFIMKSTCQMVQFLQPVLEKAHAYVTNSPQYSGSGMFTWVKAPCRGVRRGLKWSGEGGNPCLDLESVYTQQRRPWDRSAKARVHWQRTSEIFFFFPVLKLYLPSQWRKGGGNAHSWAHSRCSKNYDWMSNKSVMCFFKKQKWTLGIFYIYYLVWTRDYLYSSLLPLL